MGKMRDEDIKRVREATDIVALIGERIVLKQRGREFWGCCPFHNEKTPSFKIDPASQFWHCFGCGEGGDVFKYLMKSEDMEFPDAVRYLAERANIEIVEDGRGLPAGRRARLIAVCDETAAFYHFQLMRVKSDDVDRARRYLSGRKLGGEIPKRWNLGYAPGRGALVRHLKEKGFSYEEMIEANVALSSVDKGTDRPRTRDRFYERVMFPICDLQGRTIAFGGRIIGAGEPKYLNTADTPIFHKSENLYGIERAKSRITTTGTAIVVEGYTDVIVMHESGFGNTVATLGTALTPQHVKLLTRFAKRIIYLFDGDEAGQRAADRASTLIGDIITPESGMSRVELLVAVLPGSADPAEYCEQAGAEGMQTVLDSAIPLLRFSIERRLATWDLTVPEQRMRALGDVVGLLVPIRGSLLAADYLNELADRFGVDDETVRVALAKAKAPYPAASLTQARGEQGAAAGSVRDGQGRSPVHQGSGESEGSAGLKESKVARMERELIALYASYPSIRLKVQQDLEGYEWCYRPHRELFELLSALAPDLDVPSTFSAVASASPEAADILGATTLSCGEAEASAAAGVLVFSLKEASYERRIRAGNAKLRHPADMSPEEYDNLFTRVAELQKELKMFRRSTSK